MRTNIKPRMLRWARERAGLKTAQLVRRFPRYPEWERGERPPTRRQLEEFARVARVQVGALFLDQPPDETLPLADLRAAGGEAPQRPSPDLIDAARLCESRQEWYRDHVRAAGAEPPPFAGSARLRGPAEEAAAEMRAALRFDLPERAGFRTWKSALRGLVERAEDAGALVMISGAVNADARRRLDPEEFRGFALADDLAPLAFVNGADAEAAQMFTLARALAHLRRGRSALFGGGPDAELEYAADRWCGRAAAELLAPLAALRAECRMRADPEEEAARLARRFKVSALVMLRRMLDAGFLPRRRFQALYRRELRRLKDSARNGGGSLRPARIARTGRRFAEALVASTLEGRTLYRDAHRLLGFQQAAAFDRLARALGLAR